MYNYADSDLGFGHAIAVGRDCPITCSIEGGNQPTFTVGSPSNNFEFCFEPGALRQFVKIASDALTQTNTPRPQDTTTTEHGHTRIDVPARTARFDNLKHVSWVCISHRSPMKLLAPTDGNISFRIGSASNSFEPSFAVEALREFVRLARASLTAMDRRDERKPINELACAGAKL